MGSNKQFVKKPCLQYDSKEYEKKVSQLVPIIEDDLHSLYPEYPVMYEDLEETKSIVENVKNRMTDTIHYTNAFTSIYIKLSSLSRLERHA